MKRSLFLVMLLLSGLALRAQSSDLNLEFAFGQLKTNGATPFAKALYEADLDGARILSKTMGPMLESCGDYLEYEVLSRRSIGRRMERLVLAIHFSKRPLFLRIDLYETNTSKICLSTLVSKEASEILPFDVISSTGR